MQTLSAQPDEAVVNARRRHRRRRVIILTLRILFAVALLGSWEVLSRTKSIDPFFFGEPSGVAKQIWTWQQHGTAVGPLWEQIWTTLKEALLGFAFGVGAGVVVGIALGRVRILADVLGPYIKAANSIPRIVLGSLFVIWFGLGLTSKVALAFVLVFFVVFFNAFQGVREVDETVISNAHVLGANERKITTHVIVPSALTWIIASMHTSFGFAIVGAVVGEYLGSAHGLGNMIAVAQGTFNPNGIYACMFILAVVALIAESLITQLEDRLITWRPTRRDELAL
jgi:NitT/TauT family transport system permease protein